MNKLPVIIFLILLSSCDQSQKGHLAFKSNSIYSNLNKQKYSKREVENELSERFDQYCNERYKFCIEYPSNFIPQGEPGNGDGQIFLSKDHEVEIRAFGSLPFEGIDHTLLMKYDLVTENKEITYKKFNYNWFIVSGYDETGKIFYQ